MKTTGNTILITGGGSGIGRGLAEAFHKLGNQVIIAGRTQKSLNAVTAANPGMKSLIVDMTDPKSIATFAEKAAREFSSLNVLFNNAGIMVPEDVAHGAETHLADSKAMVETNLLGPIRLTAALLPHLLRQPNAAVINTTSGLAFVPLAMTPTYCATKAAIHSYTQSLRYQLKETSVEVKELIPPYVATTLMGKSQKSDSRAMPLEDYIKEVMEIFTTQPGSTEINVKRVHPLRFAADGGQEKYEQFFQQFNDGMSGSGH
jgi:uncharacterized oxidoreductase